MMDAGKKKQELEGSKEEQLRKNAFDDGLLQVELPSAPKCFCK